MNKYFLNFAQDQGVDDVSVINYYNTNQYFELLHSGFGVPCGVEDFESVATS